MTKTLEVFRFELAYQLRRGSTLLYFLLVLGMCMVFLQTMAGGSNDDGNFNSPFAMTVVSMFGSMLALLMMAGFAADAAARDADTRIDSLFYTSPVGKRAYVLGRFLGAFSVSALLLLALAAGSLVAAWMPWVEPESLGPVHASAYVTPYLLFALPNAFVATAVLFGLVALSRRAIASYAGAALLFFWAVICHKLLAPRLGWPAAKLLDPLGFTTIQELWLSLNTLQKNTFVLTLDGALLANRLLWLGIGLVVLICGYARFRLAHEAIGRDSTSPRVKASDDARVDTSRSAVPATRRVFGASTRMRQLLAVTMRSFRDLHTSRVWWIVPLLALFFVQTAPDIAKLQMEVPGPLTTARLLEFLGGDVSVLLTLLIALSAGELVWRDRGARIHPLADVLPVPDWVSLTGRFFGLAMMLAAALVIFLLAGLAVQTTIGTDRYDLALYVQVLFGLQLPEYLLMAALAMIVHVVVDQKYVANVLIVLVPVIRHHVQQLGVNETLLLYGNLPKWVHSEMAGLGNVEARLWFTLYFGGWALLFGLVTHLFWVRGEERGLRPRIAIARRRLTRAAATFGAVAMAIIAGAGGFIFYKTHVVIDHHTAADDEQQRAEYERRYGRYASLPQPRVTAAKLHVDFYPERGTATIRGSYRLENRSSASIAAIHVVPASGSETTNVSFDRAARVTVDDDKLDYRIYALDRALAPGESLRMQFDVAIETHAFASYGSPPVARNGSVILHRPGKGDYWLPLVGYQAGHELHNPVLRKKHGLRARPPYPQLGDAGSHQHGGYGKIALETIIGTDAGQIGVAPGEMRRTWSERGRRYVHYVTDAPISDAWTMTAANYAVHRAKWRPSAGSAQTVDIEVFHHPSHTANLERIVQSVRASLDYHTRQFGRYAHRQIRLVEYPSSPYWLQMTAHDGLITYSEGFSLVRTADDPRKIDFPFAVIAHEMAHQWWGHQLTPAMVEGAPFLTESLAWYSGMLVVEETFGRDHLKRILDTMRAQYMGPNQPREVPLLRAVEALDGYRTGPFAMYALREAVGVEPVNRTLRSVLAKFPSGRQPFPTTVDFYRELRAATPPETHGLLKDLFEDITFWELRADSLEVKATGPGAHRVIFRVEARKLKGDGTGKERPVPMNDPVEIALFDAGGKTLYRRVHRIRDGVQAIEVTLPHAPARAELDPDREFLDRNSKDNAVTVGGGAS